MPDPKPNNPLSRMTPEEYSQWWHQDQDELPPPATDDDQDTPEEI